MPKRISMTEETRAWLHDNHTSTSYSDMAAVVGCCVDTLKRILVREGLQEFDGAKYVLRRDFEEEQWTRPCMSCGDKTPRPKNHYFCPKCRCKMGYSD